MAKKRLFLAIELPYEIKKKIMDSFAKKERLSFIKKCRYTPFENLHATLLFLGDLDEEASLFIEKEMKTTEKFPQFLLHFDRFVFAPTPLHPRMIWAQFKKNEHFQKLVEYFQEKFKDVIVKKTHERLCIHVTIARFAVIDHMNKENMLYEFPACDIPPFLVEHIELFCSERTPSSVHYKKLGSYPLCKDTRS